MQWIINVLDGKVTAIFGFNGKTHIFLGENVRYRELVCCGYRTLLLYITLKRLKCCWADLLIPNFLSQNCHKT